MLATKITSEGLIALPNFKKITSLDLSYTNITNEVLEKIAQLTKLTSLDLTICDNIKKNVTQLRTALPHCRIKT